MSNDYTTGDAAHHPMPPGRDNIPRALHDQRVAVREGRASPAYLRRESADLRNLVLWARDGCGSGSHLAQALNIALTPDVRWLANILTIATESAAVREELGKLAE